MTTQAVKHRPIIIRWPNEDTGGYFKISACLINESLSLTMAQFANKYARSDYYKPDELIC